MVKLTFCDGSTWEFDSVEEAKTVQIQCEKPVKQESLSGGEVFGIFVLGFIIFCVLLSK